MNNLSHVYLEVTDETDIDDVDLDAVRQFVNDRGVAAPAIPIKSALIHAIGKLFHRFGVHEFVPFVMYDARSDRLVETDQLICRNCK